MSGARLNVTEGELGVLAEALREALAAALLRVESIGTAQELLDRIDAKLPSIAARHRAGAAGRLIAGNELVRVLMARASRYGHATMTREELAREVDAPLGRSVRSLLDDLVREGLLRVSTHGPSRRYGLTAKGRGHARSLDEIGAPADELIVTDASELLDLIYADSCGTACLGRSEGEAGIWHVPTVMAAARLGADASERLESALAADGLVGERIHSYGTITQSGEDLCQ